MNGSAVIAPDLEFEVDGRRCCLVLPRSPAPPAKPWIWRPEFFDAWPQADLALLDRGFHVAYMDLRDLYGAPVAMGHMDAFYRHLTDVRGLSPKVVLEGFSRGGLFALNWAARNPQKVACIYLDAPVCDFKSWPGGRGKRSVVAADWEKLKKAYGFADDRQALDYPLNPIDNLEPLARAGIAILSVCGDADTSVPLEENTRVLEQRYRQLGGRITVIIKPGCQHHPHSLEDPSPIVRFILQHAGQGDDPDRR